MDMAQPQKTKLSARRKFTTIESKTLEKPKNSKYKMNEPMVSSSTKAVQDGVWIGVDFGTSNSTCAVWDSTRGSSKWMRLDKIAILESSGKVGRSVPSVLKWSHPDPPLVGAQALKEEATGTLIPSIKRLLGTRYTELDRHLISSMPFEAKEGKDGDVCIAVEPNGNTTTPLEVMSIILQAIREAAQRYLDKYQQKKHLQVPGSGKIRNVVVGVPAHYSKRHVQLVEQACLQAGFEGHVSTCLESTAAAMSYGLTMQQQSEKATIMVVDCGGGTTDITIATKQKRDGNDESHSSSSKVLVTLGDPQLGGDDIDQALMEFCLLQLQKQTEGRTTMFEKNKGKAKSDLLEACRKAKEALCNEENPSQSEAISVGGNNQLIHVSQEQFETLLEPWLTRAQQLICKAIEQFQQHDDEDRGCHPSREISEVILVGGTTRVPAIRRVIQRLFPKVELCTSLNPMSSVAIGLAIQAALHSKAVPLHELQSALMLDCIPHSIGAQLANDYFVEIIPRNTPLPACGSATFVLADKYQPGVTIRAAEYIRQEGRDDLANDYKLEPMAKEDFSFLLRRLPPEDYKRISERSVQVGMKVDKQGRFIVSIFDEMDPEQVRKRRRFEKANMAGGSVAGELGYISGLVWAESEATMEQALLLGIFVGVLVLYIAVKLAFNEPTVEGEPII